MVLVASQTFCNTKEVNLLTKINFTEAVSSFGTIVFYWGLLTSSLTRYSSQEVNLFISRGGWIGPHGISTSAKFVHNCESVAKVDHIEQIYNF